VMLAMNDVWYNANAVQLICDRDHRLTKFVRYIAKQGAVADGLMSGPQQFPSDIENIQL